MKKSLLIITIIALGLWSCSSNEPKEESTGLSGELVILHAGSLAVPLMQVSKAFEKQHPNVKILLEGAGSVACARKITELNRACDIMASADYKIIDEMLMPDHSVFNIQFATNEMVIAFTEKSKLRESINADNWFEILQNDEVSYGRSDPDSDPCGYRSVLVSKLSENFYNQPGLADAILSKDNKYIRPKETDLLALLETGAIDYIFIYRSVAGQHGLEYVSLPDSINLKTNTLEAYYQTVSTEIKGKKPGEMLTKQGSAMVYGITMLKQAPNPEVATAFMQFFLGENGQKIMKQNGQQSVVPAPSDSYTAIPSELQQYAHEGL